MKSLIRVYLLSIILVNSSNVVRMVRASDASLDLPGPRQTPQPEVENLPYVPWSPNETFGAPVHCGPWTYGPFQSRQVNANAQGCNIPGDAANGPSIAVSPPDPDRLVIGWRQFNSVTSDFRSAGFAYSADGGTSWTFPGSILPTNFYSLPVLQADNNGVFYYLVVNSMPRSTLFRSLDGGVTWLSGTNALGGDKHWLAIDNTNGIGEGNLYNLWSPFSGCCDLNIFARSIDGGEEFMTPVFVPNSPWSGTIAVGPEGQVYASGDGTTGLVVARSLNANNPSVTPTFAGVATVNLGGPIIWGGPPNPGGLLGQAWVVADHSEGATHGNVYLLASVNPTGTDPLDVMISRSTNGGVSWSPAVRVNSDHSAPNAWQWFGGLSIAPNGRLDAIWYDTRAMQNSRYSQLYYASSSDAGQTWSANYPLSRVFDSLIGYAENQNSMSHSIQAVSDNESVAIAYTATFNGEQDIYFVRMRANDCNENGIDDADEVATGAADDCNGDFVPDDCNEDCNANSIADSCEIDNGATEDCNSNMTPDECDPNFDGDDQIDDCDGDIDNDGLVNAADVCDFSAVGAAIRANGATIGDTNNDCDVDLVDYSTLDNCILLGGPSDPIPGSCLTSFNADGDADIDLHDVANFQIAFGGP